MKKDELLVYLESFGCTIVRTDKKGYSIIRNPINGQMSGIPKEEVLRSATVCRICLTLDIDKPEVPGLDAVFSKMQQIQADHTSKGYGEQ